MLDATSLERDDLTHPKIPRPDTRPPAGRSATPASETALLRESPVEDDKPAPADRNHASPSKNEAHHRGGFLRRRPLVSAIGGLTLATALGGGVLYVDHAWHFESTDDAFIAARQSSLAPKVSGYLITVPVDDNQHVVPGDVIARIDDRDYRIALQQAEAQVAAAKASIENFDAQLNVQKAQITANEAQVDQAQAGLVFAQQQAARYEHLGQTGYGSVQNAEQYSSQLRQQQASVQSTQANLKLAQRQIGALNAQRENAVASFEQAEAQRDQAKLNLSYTTVTAAQAGRVTNLSAAVGQFVQPGTNLTMFVPDRIWITANFKEIQLNHIRPGEPVTLHIDAYPDRALQGHIDSVQSGSGTAFSVLPAQNATGNYVKIVQRVPVKIVIDNPPADIALGPGMSVVPTVRTDASPSLYEDLRRAL